MNIDTVGHDKIKIRLTNDEINCLFGGYDMIDYERPRSKTVLNTLLSTALPSDALPLDCKKVLIEVRPVYGGCSIVFTRIGEHAKRLHKVKKGKGFVVVFDDGKNMVSLLKQVSSAPLKCRLLLYGEKYALHFILDSENKADRLHLNEYGNAFEEKSVGAAHILEHSSVISDDALKVINSVF